ncbi:MAG: hypothetical protein ABI729_05595 [Chitinophagales bacterium]
MKKLSDSRITGAGLLLIMLLITTFSFSTDATAAVRKPNAQVNASIPDQWKSNIIKEQNGAVTSFSLVNGNSAPVFLFSVTEISEQEWIKMKTQMPDIKLLERKNGNIYYSYKNQKEKVKGACNELYLEIYPHLDQMITGVQID